MPRSCFREPIGEIFEAAELLDHAADAHLAGDFNEASRLIRVSDNAAIAAWTESIWGKRSPEIHSFAAQDLPLPHLAAADRPTPRMPDKITQAAIVERDGFHCPLLWRSRHTHGCAPNALPNIS